MRILISAGEASGEMYGAELLRALRRRVPDIEAFGVGGERMRTAGFEAVVESRDVAVVGLAEVVSHLPSIYRHFKRLLREVDVRKPDVAVLIDFPDFNFRLAKQLHRRGIPVVYYISPQLWAWRKGRIKLVQKYVTRMLVIFPFEEEFYRKHGVEAEFVGHPLGELEVDPLPASFNVPRWPADDFEGWIALLPGSRRKEVEMNLPIMLEAANLLFDGDNRRQFVMPVASTISKSWLLKLVRQQAFGSIELVDDARFALANSRAAIVASGTATVEAAVIGTPFVMVYRVSPLTWVLGRRLVNVPFFSMVNLIAGREVVPELVQQDFTPQNVAGRVQEILEDGPKRQAMIAGLAEVKAQLREGAAGAASERAADAVLKAIGAHAGRA
jgi:lipid-A-disaccharide synthase